MALDGYFQQLQQTRDLIVLHPDVPNLDELLAKFDRIHTHAEDEVRYILDGAGVFGFVRPDGSQVELTVEAADYINVPAGTEHWFYLTPQRRIKAIRYFTGTAGYRNPFSLCTGVMRRIVLYDFDGTITAVETFVAMFKEFAPDVSAQLLPQMYTRQLTLRQGVRQILESIPSHCYPDILECTRSQPIRPGFIELLDFLETHQVPLVVVSGGLQGMVEVGVARTCASGLRNSRD